MVRLDFNFVLFFRGIEDDYNIQLINASKFVLPVLNVVEMSQRHVLRFSKKFFKFQYCPLQIVRSRLTDTLKITNSSKKNIEFSMNIDEIAPNFKLTWKDGPETMVNQYVIFSLNPGEELELIFTLNPIDPVNVVKNLPIHLREYKSGLVFCYIRLEAKYIQPFFELPQAVFLKPVLPNIPITDTIQIWAKHHPSNCTVTTSSDNEYVTVMAEHNNVTSKLACAAQPMDIQLQFVSPIPIKVVSRIKFSCSCGVTDFFTVFACADDNLVTAYLCNIISQPLATTTVRKNLDFPYFPKDNDQSDYAKYMITTVKVVEQFLFHQIFHKSYYYFIPESMAELYRYPYEKHMPETLTLVKMLTIICGPDVLQFIANR